MAQRDPPTEDALRCRGGDKAGAPVFFLQRYPLTTWLPTAFVERIDPSQGIRASCPLACEKAARFPRANDRYSRWPQIRNTGQRRGVKRCPRRGVMSGSAARQIVHIDEVLCTGCGACVGPCAEGAIEIVDGKARVLREELCDGAGFCLGVCPTGALTVERRSAVPFDHDAVQTHVAEKPRDYVAQSCYKCGATEDDAPLVPIRTAGQSTWCCTRCLPTLIHG